jgi:hypothetical protein
MRCAVVPAYACLSCEFFEKVVHILFCVGNGLDAVLELLELMMIAERVQELIAMPLVMKSVSNVIDQTVELLLDCLGSDRIAVHNRAHDQDWEPRE